MIPGSGRSSTISSRTRAHSPQQTAECASPRGGCAVRSRSRSMTMAPASRRRLWSASSNASTPTGLIRALGRIPGLGFPSRARSSRRTAGASAPRIAWASRSTTAPEYLGRVSWCACPRCKLRSPLRGGAPDEPRSLSYRLGTHGVQRPCTCRRRGRARASERYTDPQVAWPHLCDGADRDLPHEFRDLSPRGVLVSALVWRSCTHRHRRRLCVRALQAATRLDALAPELHDCELLRPDCRRRE